METKCVKRLAMVVLLAEPEPATTTDPYTGEVICASYGTTPSIDYVSLSLALLTMEAYKGHVEKIIKS